MPRVKQTNPRRNRRRRIRMLYLEQSHGGFVMGRVPRSPIPLPPDPVPVTILEPKKSTHSNRPSKIQRAVLLRRDRGKRLMQRKYVLLDQSALAPDEG